MKKYGVVYGIENIVENITYICFNTGGNINDTYLYPEQFAQRIFDELMLGNKKIGRFFIGNNFIRNDIRKINDKSKWRLIYLAVDVPIEEITNRKNEIIKFYQDEHKKLYNAKAITTSYIDVNVDDNAIDTNIINENVDYSNILDNDSYDDLGTLYEIIKRKNDDIRYVGFIRNFKYNGVVYEDKDAVKFIFDGLLNNLYYAIQNRFNHASSLKKDVMNTIGNKYDTWGYQILGKCNKKIAENMKIKRIDDLFKRGISVYNAVGIDQVNLSNKKVCLDNTYKQHSKFYTCYCIPLNKYFVSYTSGSIDPYNKQLYKTPLYVIESIKNKLRLGKFNAHATMKLKEALLQYPNFDKDWQFIIEDETFYTTDKTELNAIRTQFIKHYTDLEEENISNMNNNVDDYEYDDSLIKNDVNVDSTANTTYFSENILKDIIEKYFKENISKTTKLNIIKNENNNILYEVVELNKQIEELVNKRIRKENAYSKNEEELNNINDVIEKNEEIINVLKNQYFLQFNKEYIDE